MLDPYQRPPDNIRNVYKKFQKMKLADLKADQDIIDLEDAKAVGKNSKLSVVDDLGAEKLAAVFLSFAGPDAMKKFAKTALPAYEHEDMPGLHIIPDLLPPEIQTILLTRLLHRDLSNPAHLTNIHTHYTLAYPTTSFFSYPPTHPAPLATPLNPSIHRPLTISQLFNKKLRWMTLGGQYDWTQKKYPDAIPPEFPKDVGGLLEGIWKDTRPEAAIVNLYSPGDTLSVHRDVSESSSRGLISISLGCDAIFVIGDGEEHRKGDTVLTIRLKSGSAVYMSGPSRFAWHGVPQIVPGTCPEYLRDWPAGADGQFEEWRGWMDGKRVNLNVRQMWDRDSSEV
ncbi:hypothetical protein CC78DRAFT_508257 [Lojkania enalia]|uniref:mRNA N(6)-methyladenine demethylase n=1 Tax=Lojkania enalia TaxID=147567 RepID=A0A9P4NAL7_9PLEO|nr:hypothetical protein CC78DRAFT_508257 [Didymosphaeria enalia]